jgi:chromosome segregation ATPase
MPNSTLLIVLHDLSRELTEKQAKNNVCIEKRRAVVEGLTEGVRRAEEKEACAAHEDEEIKMKMNALRNHLNSLTEKPLVLQRKLESLQGEQSHAYRKRQVVSESVQEKKRELQEAKTRLAVAEKEHETLQKEWKEVSGQIQKIGDDA